MFVTTLKDHWSNNDEQLKLRHSRLNCLLDDSVAIMEEIRALKFLIESLTQLYGSCPQGVDYSPNASLP